MKPKLFIGSSVEELALAEAVKLHLSNPCRCDALQGARCCVGRMDERISSEVLQAREESSRS
jgi:hypothetical protein